MRQKILWANMLCAFVLCLGTTALAIKQQRKPAVVAGHLAEADDEFRLYTVLIRPHEKGRISQCSGVLISPRTILTAAHCMYQRTTYRKTGRIEPVTEVTIQLGLSQSDPELFTATSAEVLLHPTFKVAPESDEIRPSASSPIDKAMRTPEIWTNYLNSKKEFEAATTWTSVEPGEKVFYDGYTDDLAMIYLDQDIPNPFRPARLYTPEIEGFGFKNLYFTAGFGPATLNPTDKEWLAENTDPQLRYAQNQMKGYLLQGENLALLLGWPKEDVWNCSGDSGGPVMLEADGIFYLFGLHIGDRNQCLGNKVELYLPTHRPWIEANLR